MTDRERLIELKINFVENFDCGDCKPSNNKCRKCLSEKEADYLIKHGIIVPPCKVGDTVYYITGIGHNLVKPAKVKEIIIDENGIKDLYVQGDGYDFENSFDIFFLTREEAEEKLKECKRNV